MIKSICLISDGIRQFFYDIVFLFVLIVAA